MAGRVTTKVRLVKCPKCRQLLLELPGLDIYQCGGCNTTLQAKKRVSDAKTTTSSLHDVGVSQTDKLDHVSECKEPSSSCDNKKLEVSNKACSSIEINGNENGKLADNEIEDLADNENAKTTTSSLHDVGALQTDKLDHVSECKEPSSSCDNKKLEVSNKVCSSIEIYGNENGKLADNEIEDLADTENEDLAKKRVNDAKTTTSSLHDVGASQTDKLDHVSECKEPSSSCDNKKLEVSNKVCSSIEINGNEIEDLADTENEDLVKKRLNDAKTTTSSLHDVGASQTDKLDHVSECKEPSSSCDNKKLEVSNKVCSSIEINGNENGKLADNEIEDLADNENEHLADNEKEDLTDDDNEGLADVGNKDMADNGNEELANSKNEEFPDNEDVEFGCKVNEGFAHQNGHFADNENEESEHNENDEFSHQNGHLVNDGNGESEDNENEGFAHNKIGDFSHNEIEDLADNENKDLAENENEDLADKENEDLADNENKGFADNENKGFADNGSGELADNENEELPDSEDEEFASKENEGFAHKNGHFADNENEESEDNENEGFAHNRIDFAHNENEEFEYNENEEIADNGSQEFSHKKNEEFTHNNNEESLPLTGTDLKVSENDEFSPLTEVNMVDVNRESDSNFGSSSTVKLVAAVGNGSIASAHGPLGEGISSDTLISSPSEQLEKPEVCVHRGSGHVRSTGTSESMEFNPSSELGGTLRNMSNSSTVRSSHFYDGSVSSYDGIYDQFPNPQMHPIQGTYKTSHFVHSEERSRRDKFLVNKNSQMQRPPRNSWSDKKKRVLKTSNWDQDEFLKPARYGHKNQNWTRLERDEYQTKLPFPQIGLQAGYENGSSSTQFHDEFQRNSGFQSSDLSEDLEQDKMKLMRMIFELQDQLNKTLSLREMGNDGISEPSRKPRYVPQYHNYDALEEGHFHHSNYLRHGRYGARSSYSQDPRSMQIPFSGEATSSGHQVDPSCLHCHPQNWQRSAQLPLPLLYHKNKKCRIHPGHNCCTSYSSCPSSPQRFVDSEFPLRGRETMSDDQRRKSHEVKSYLREKTHLVKRHLRPIAGGAPFITCYRCFKLLQLPADFLLFKRRSHRLRCGACSELLKFSLYDGSHIVPYTLNDTVPPPSEVEDCSDAIDRRNLTLASNTNGHFVQADPMSCSDDYGLSYCQSCSTEGDLVATAPYHTYQGSMDGKRVSNGSFDPMRDRKQLVSKQSRNKYKNSMLRYESAGPSSNIYKAEKFSSEIEEFHRSSGSPLHRLMGYSSPSEVIRAGKGTNQNSMQEDD